MCLSFNLELTSQFPAQERLASCFTTKTNQIPQRDANASQQPSRRLFLIAMLLVGSFLLQAQMRKIHRVTLMMRRKYSLIRHMFHSFNLLLSSILGVYSYVWFLSPLCFIDQVVVSAIRSKAREAKLRRKTSLLSDSFKLDSFSRVFSPRTGELFATPKELQQREDDDDDEEDDEEREDYFSVRSYLSRASSVASREAFLSVKTNFSRSSSLSGIDFYEFRRPSIIEELCHCEGWPFGLCRRAMLLPPLPKSPSESWSWRKGTRVVKMN